MFTLAIPTSMSRLTSRLSTLGYQELMIPPPAIIIKTASLTTQCTSHRSALTRASILQDMIQRMTNNIARIYARRVLEIAAMSAASVVSKTQLEAAILKPTEWSTIDLESQRREFGESISSLGRTKIERLWAAGMNLLDNDLLADWLF